MMVANCLILWIIYSSVWTGVASRRQNDQTVLLQRLDRLEKQQSESSSKIDTLEKLVKEQARIIELQSQEIKSQKRLTTSLRTHLHHVRRMAAFNRHKIRTFMKTRQDLAAVGKGQMEVLRGETGQDHLRNSTGRKQELVSNEVPIHNSRRIRRISDDVAGRFHKRQERAGIAFSVYLDHAVDIGSHQTIKFNKVITNEGNGYNVHTGAFTCPESGIYLFSFFIGQRGTTSPSGIYAELLVNSQHVVEAVVDSYHNAQDLQGGNTVVVRLQQGDVVWVDALADGSHAEGRPEVRTSTFTGVHLSP